MIFSDDQSHKLIEVLQKAAAKTNSVRSSSGGRSGLTNLQAGILGVVNHDNGCTMGQLSRSLSLHPPAATRLVDSLLEEGLVERYTDSEDRRIIRLQLTMRGRYLCDMLQREEASRFLRALKMMTEEEVEKLISGLERWTEAVGSTTG